MSDQTDLVKEYCRITDEMMRERIRNKMVDWSDKERNYLEQLDEIWYKCSDEELDQIEENSSLWWFGDQYGKWEPDIYPYAAYFIAQEPRMIKYKRNVVGDQISFTPDMKGKPFFGDQKWRVGDPMLAFIIEEENDTGETQIDLHMKLMSNRHYTELQDGYDFVRYINKIPVFKKKEVNENRSY